MGDTAGHRWLGLVSGGTEEQDSDGNGWRLPVTNGLTSGANALFGGCATAAALVIARDVAPQPLLWAGAHFGALAQRDTTVDLEATTISAGRTMTHLQVAGTVDGRESFVARIAAGDRPAGRAEGAWVSPPPVKAPDDAALFDHPVHAGTWGARFEWRLAGSTTDADTDTDAGQPFAAWWVRPAAGEPADPLVVAAVLVDYVTYGIGRALGVPMGGLSVDNVVRIHDLEAHRRQDPTDWLLLDVRPEAISGGFGYGSARLFTREGALLATGTQTVVVNQWDWRLPAEREAEGDGSQAGE